MRGLKEPKEFKIVRQDGNHPGTSAEKQPNGITPGDIFSRIALICSAATAILGILVMTGWVTGIRSLASLGSGSIPQAPGAALAFILLGSTWFFYLYSPSRKLARMSVLISVLFVLLVSILNLIWFFTGINTVIEEFLVRRVLALGPGIYGAGPMSPITVANFILACTAIILLLAPVRRWAGLSGGFASVLVSVNLIILLGYLYGTPLLYGGEIRPVSLPSGVMFTFLGTGLIASAGPGHFPLRLLVGPSVHPLLLRTFLLVIFVFALIHAVIYNLFSQLIINEALRTALAVLVSVTVTGAVVLQLSRTIGGTIEREEAERRKAEEALRIAYEELELRVQERTGELAKTNKGLQAEITERRRAEEGREKLYRETQAAREQITTILESITDAFVSLDQDWRYTYVNRRAAQLLGKSAGELIGQSPWEIFPFTVGTLPYREFHRSVAEQVPIHFEYYEPALGRWFENYLYPSKHGLSIYWHDITDRKRLENEQRRAKELSDALNNINTAINSTLDLDEIMRRVIMESAKAIGCETSAITMREGDYWVVRYIYGISEELIGSHFTDEELPHVAFAARTKQSVVINDVYSDKRINREVMERFSVRSVLVIPLIVRERVIGIIYFNYHSAAIPFTEAQIDFANKLGASLTLALENARLFKAEQDAHRKEEERAGRFETLHQITNVAISSLDTKEVARNAISIMNIRLGFSAANIWLADKVREELLPVASIGFPPRYFEILPPIKFDSQYEVSRIFSSGRTAIVEDFAAAPVSEVLKEAYRKAGIKAGSYIAIPLKSKKETVGVIGIIWQEPRKFTREDIDFFTSVANEIAIGLDNARLFEDLKRTEGDLKRLTAELARSNAELEQFAYIASHDLQEPLRMVSGFTQLLAKRYKGKLDKSADEFIGFIVDGTTRMQKMIEDLLAYSRVGTRGKPFEPANLETVLNQAMTNLKVIIQENKAIITHDTLPTVMADTSQMVQLFQNLISNAIKFRKKEEPPRIHISAQRMGSEWVFSVRDNGIGIEPEFFGRLFQLFQRAHAAGEYPGTGIGLAICKRIVERHSGRIWAESEVGKGSTFYFTIPVRKGELS